MNTFGRITYSKVGLGNFAVNHLFTILNILTVISAYVIDIRAGIVSSLMIICVLLMKSKSLGILFHDQLFLFYLCCNFISIVWYLFNNRPLTLFVQCISYNIIPSMLYLLGAYCAIKGKDIFGSILNNNLFIMGFGLVILLVPSLAASVEENASSVSGSLRYGSYLGSLPLGSLIAVSIPILFLCAKKMHKILFACSAVLIGVALVLTMQRGAWVAGAAALVLCVVVQINSKGNRFQRTVFLAIGFIVLGLVIYFIYDRYFPDYYKRYFMVRVMQTDISMFTSRSYQFSDGLKLLIKYPLGFGLGAAGNKASAFGLQVVPDGNFLRILVELGLVGFASFVVLNIRALRRGFRQKCYYHVVLILVFLLHAIGSNVFDFYYSSFIYWFALGFITYNRNKDFVSRQEG